MTRSDHPTAALDRTEEGSPLQAPPEPGLDTPAAAPRRRLTGGRLLHLYTWLIILWLMLPVFVMIVFGFNDTPGRYNQTWEGFTLKWYGQVFGIDALTEALIVSLVVAIVTMLVAGALGTGIGYALGRYRFRGTGTVNLVLFATISAPELVMGASLLTLFVSMGVGLGVVTITIAHIMFSISFVAVVVRSRVLTLDRSIEEAAADLGANAWTTFWRITFPLILPAVGSGMMLAFALSIDDFVVTNFTAGTTTTFPLWIWGATRVGLPPQVNVMGTLIFAVGVVIAVVSSVRSWRPGSPRRPKEQAPEGAQPGPAS
jgi:spermidine/putrescine transport system permease protein